MKLTENFSLAEMTRSATAQRLGVTNAPSDTVIVNLLCLCQNVLQPLRDHVGRPLTITSGYRCPVVNRAVGGVSDSQHLQGLAADIAIPQRADGRGQDIPLAMEWIGYIISNLPYDQLILERNSKGHQWIHVSSLRDLTKNRKQVMLGLEKK